LDYTGLPVQIVMNPTVVSGNKRKRVVVRDNLTGQIGSVSAPLELK
jgi:hypothetical protein